MKFKVTVILLLLSTSFMVNAQEIPSTKFGKGIFNIVGKDSSWTMKVGARMQFLTLASWENDHGELTNGEARTRILQGTVKLSKDIT